MWFALRVMPMFVLTGMISSGCHLPQYLMRPILGEVLKAERRVRTPLRRTNIEIIIIAPGKCCSNE